MKRIYSFSNISVIDLAERVSKMAKEHLGPNQRAILKILAKEPNLTEREIASKVYGKPVMCYDSEYTATSRSLRGLAKRGLVERTSAEAKWKLKTKKKRKEN